MAGSQRALCTNRVLTKSGEVREYRYLSGNKPAKPILEKFPWIVSVEEIERRRSQGETLKDLMAEFGINNNITYDKYKKKWLEGELGVAQVAGEELAAS